MSLPALKYYDTPSDDYNALAESCDLINGWLTAVHTAKAFDAVEAGRIGAAVDLIARDVPAMDEFACDLMATELPDVVAESGDLIDFYNILSDRLADTIGYIDTAVQDEGVSCDEYDALQARLTRLAKDVAIVNVADIAAHRDGVAA